MAFTQVTKAFAVLSIVGLIVSCGGCSNKESEGNVSASVQELNQWEGPYGGVPAWDQVKPESFPADFDKAIAQHWTEIEAIANSPEAPTFENTVVALEKAGQPLARLSTIFSVHSSNLNVGVMPQIEEEINPKLSAHEDRITQNSQLFARIKSVYENQSGLSDSQKRLVEKLYKASVREGATLNAGDKEKLTKLNSRLSALETTFGQNVLNDESELVTWIENETDLAGLSEELKSVYADAATTLKKPGKWAVRNTRSAMEPFLTFAENRGLREKVWKTYYSRGDRGDKNDNNKIVTEILQLRQERARLLGYETHAHLRLEPTMARTPDAAMELMMAVWPKAVERVREEVADMQALADKEPQKIQIEGWDYRYYAEKVRKAKFALDSDEIRQYLQLEKLISASHYMAQEVFGYTFTRINDVSIFHPDVRVYKVTDRSNRLVGLWYLDPYARDGKRSGAWMSDYRLQSNMDGKWITAIVSNNSNFSKAKDGKAVLISWDDAVTLFHEFGHALHGLASQAVYPSQSGTNVTRDYVEFPSQLLEHWFPTKEILSKFARHVQTDKPMPDSLLAKIEKAATFNQGFETVELLASALVDMKLHLTKETVDPKKFERETLAALDMPKEIVMRHRTPQFGHIFGTGYDAGYYSYLWSDALTADAAELFAEQKDSFFDKKTGQSLIEHVFSVGDTIDPAEGFRRFRGRDVDTKALLRKRGFPVN